MRSNLLSQTINSPLVPQITGINFFEQLVPNLISLGIIIAAIVFVLVLIWGAISWITSGGDKANIEAARGRIIAAIVGLAILFSIWAILKVLQLFFGINILTLDILNLAIQ